MGAVRIRTNVEHASAISSSLSLGLAHWDEHIKKLTSYWQRNTDVAQFKILDEQGLVEMSGGSAFFFHHNTPAGILGALDRNLFLRRLRMAAQQGGSELQERCLSLSIPQSPAPLTRFGLNLFGKRITYHFLKSLYHLYSIVPFLEDRGLANGKHLTVCEIGAGTGYMALAVKLLFPNSTYIIVDLPPILPFSSVFLSTVFPDHRFLFYNCYREEDVRLTDYDFVFLPHYEISTLPDSMCHLLVNIDSLQEMQMDVIEGYFQEIRRLLKEPNFFYCNNNRVDLQDGERIELSSYPYHPDDVQLFSRENEFMKYVWITKKLINRVPYLVTRFKKSGDFASIQQLTVMDPNVTK